MYYVCLWNVQLLPTYKVYRLYDTLQSHFIRAYKLTDKVPVVRAQAC